MSAVVTFNYQTWAARYPEFCNVSAAQAQTFWDEATIYQRNDGTGPVTKDSVQSMLLNMLTAHIAYLNVGVNGQPASRLVGRIAGATEGSVSVQTDYASNTPGSMAWFTQSPYGAAWWQATSQYRTMHYRPGGFGCRPYGAWGRW